jgi:hypothetical protein
MSGYFYSGPRDCHSSVEAIANEVAEKAKQMRTVFPDLKVGDIEPVGLTEPAGWANSVIEWTQAYKAAVGEPFVRALRQAMARTMAGAVSQIEGAAACRRDPRRRDPRRVRCRQDRRGMDTARAGPVHQRLLKGEGRVREAQEAMIANPAPRHLYYWAAFVHIGDWTPLAAKGLAQPE